MRPVTSTILAVSLALALPACDGGATSEPVPTGGGAADETGEGFEVTLAQAGAFSRALAMHSPMFFHYGFGDEPLPGWKHAGDVEIEYDGSGLSLPVTVKVPEDQRGKFLGFVLFARDETDSTCDLNCKGMDDCPSFCIDGTRDQFIDLDAPDGAFHQLPVSNGAAFPFAAECFDITVTDATPEGNQSAFAGKIASVVYGFTSATLEEYVANNDVPFEDIRGKHVHQDFLNPGFDHDGGFKGSVRIREEWIRVPAGKNLVFKLFFDKFGGNCPFGDDTKLTESGVGTQTFFVEG